MYLATSILKKYAKYERQSSFTVFNKVQQTFEDFLRMTKPFSYNSIKTKQMSWLFSQWYRLRESKTKEG